MTDIAYVPTAAGFLFLSVVLVAWLRRIVGRATATDLRARLVLDALDMAVTTRKPADVVHDSDQGSQCTSVAFGFRNKEVGIRHSTSVTVLVPMAIRRRAGRKRIIGRDGMAIRASE